MTIATVLGIKGREVETIDCSAALGEAARRLAERRIGALVVTRSGEVAGILSERDLVHCLTAHGSGALDRKVEEAMTAEVHTVAPDSQVLAALAMMTNRRVRHLPVIEGGQLAGIVSIGDLVKYRMEQIEADADAMRLYIQSA